MITIDLLRNHPGSIPRLAKLAYQNRGIAKLLMDATKQKAKILQFNQCYLFAFDPTIPDYYTRQGWNAIGMDEFMDHPVTVMEIKL